MSGEFFTYDKDGNLKKVEAFPETPDLVTKTIYDLMAAYDRDMIAACLTFDINEFKKMFEKWSGRGIFPPCFELPSDEVLEITLRKIVVNRIDCPPEKQAAAMEWLLSRGYDLSLNGEEEE